MRSNLAIDLLGEKRFAESPDATSLALQTLRVGWGDAVSNCECTLHQLAPYIGKLKSTIAADLIRTFTQEGQRIADPFCGAGTIPLEAALTGRDVFAADVSPYATLLTSAKLSAPRSLESALERVDQLLNEAQAASSPDLRKVPSWVRRYFHPNTLKEILTFTSVCLEQNQWFPLSCLLGILHHQRPGFLSYPSSHLVPYLRDRKFPPNEFPELYGYRAIRPRLIAKVERAYKRIQVRRSRINEVVRSPIDQLQLPANLDAIITSPPYMNALDYGRDNRLRLWFVDSDAAEDIDACTPASVEQFCSVMAILARSAAESLKRGGHCVLVIGEVVRSTRSHPVEVALDAFLSGKYAFELTAKLFDSIPDVRRSRRDCRGVKTECVIAFRRR